MNAGMPGVALWTLAGSIFETRPLHGLLARAGAARAAGFTRIGACTTDYRNRDQARFDTGYLRAAGMAVTDIEFIKLDEARDPDQEYAAFALADALTQAGAADRLSLKIGWCSPEPVYDSTVTRRVRDLADRAAEHDMRLGFEPVCFGRLGNVDHATHIITAAARPNIGLVLDVYHVGRVYGDQWPDVTPDLVTGIEVCGLSRGALAWPDALKHDALCGRLLPTEGVFPVAQWVASLREAGVTARVCAEVMSDRLRGLPVHGAAREVAASLTVLAAVPVT